MAGRNVDFVNTIPGRCALSVNDPNSSAPRGWAWIKLTEIARLESGHTPSRNHPEYWDGDIAWIGIKDAREHHAGVIDDTLQHVTQAGIDNSAARLLPAKTVCLSRTASVGYVVVMGRPMATSQDFVNWVCTPALEPDYLKWLLLAEGGDGLRKFGKGSTHTTIYFPEVQAFHACVAPLNEQRRIVAKLDAIFEQTRAAKARLERLPALLEKLKRSILAAAFRGDLTRDWRAAHPNVEPADVLLAGVRERRRRKREGSEVRMRKPQDKHPIDHQQKALPEEADDEAEGLFEVPPTWRWCRFDQLATSFRGGTPTRAENAETVWPVLRSSAVRHGEIDFDDVRYLQSAEHETDADLVCKGDLLFTRLSGTLDYVGNCAIVRDQPDRATYYPDRIFRAQIDEAISAEFIELAFSVRLLRGALENSAKSSAGHQRISLSDLRDFVLPIPPFEEQKEISNLVNAAVREIAKVRIRIEHAQDLNRRCEQAALAKAFRGDLVPQDPTDEPASILLDRIHAARVAEPMAQRRGRERRSSESDKVVVEPTNGHAAAHPEDPLDLVIAAFQQGEPRLGATALTQATGLDAAAVKRALATLVDSGQVRVHGRARGTTYEWAT